MIITFFHVLGHSIFRTVRNKTIQSFLTVISNNGVELITSVSWNIHSQNWSMNFERWVTRSTIWCKINIDTPQQFTYHSFMAIKSISLCTLNVTKIVMESSDLISIVFPFRNILRGSVCFYYILASSNKSIITNNHEPNVLRLFWGNKISYLI